MISEPSLLDEIVKKCFRLQVALVSLFTIGASLDSRTSITPAVSHASFAALISSLLARTLS